MHERDLDLSRQDRPVGPEKARGAHRIVAADDQRFIVLLGDRQKPGFEIDEGVLL